MKYRLPNFRKLRLVRLSDRYGFVAGLATCVLGLNINAADITVSGLDDVVKGDVFAQVLVDEPVQQVHMKISGVVSRIERSAPYGLMSDQKGKLNPWDTTAHANGEYVMTVVATLEDGEEVTGYFPFAIRNEMPAVKSTEVSIAMGKLPSQVHVGQQFTIPTTGLEDGEVVWLHLFDAKWGDLIVRNFEVKNSAVTFAIPQTDGLRRLQLQYEKSYKRTKRIQVLPKVQLPTVEAEPIAETPVVDVIEPTPAPVEPTVEVPEVAAEVDPVPDVVTEVDVALDTPSEGLLEVLPPSVDLSRVPASLTVGQRIYVPVTGIADGQTLYFHLFDSQWGDLIRSNVVVDNGRVELLIPNVSGKRILQLQHGKGFKAKKTVTVGSATVQPIAETPVVDVIEPTPAPVEPTVEAPEVAAEVDPVPDVNPLPITPNTDGSSGLPDVLNDPVQLLSPGSGWRGETAVPGQIGDRHERAIAHWNVVPEQHVSNGFRVGVIAQHIDGIDRVEISANNGAWVRISEATTNPRTRCEEYWAELDLSGHNGPIELRAIAYPKKGKPFLVEPLGGAYSEQDLTLYTEFVGEILELDAGEHNLSERALPDKGWLIVRPKPGVAREDCILVGESENWRGGRLKLENLTLRLPEGNNAMRGKYQEGSITGHHVWFDKCRIIGNGPKDTTAWIAFMWETATYTDCQISHVQTVFHGYRGIDTLARNCYVHDIYEDTFRSGGLHVNIKIENVDREPLVVAQGLQNASSRDKPHPDLWQLQHIQNTIIQDVTATNNINAQGFFPARSTNVALVRVNIDTVSPYRSFQMMDETQNVLIRACKFEGGAGFRGSVIEGERLKFWDTEAGNSPPFLPDGWDSPGVYTYPSAPIYD